jgi:hypothetical protein
VVAGADVVGNNAEVARKTGEDITSSSAARSLLSTARPPHPAYEQTIERFPAAYRNVRNPRGNDQCFSQAGAAETTRMGGAGCSKRSAAPALGSQYFLRVKP